MKKQTISNILEFLKRTSLRWEEVQAYTKCIEELVAEYEEEPKEIWKWE